MRKFVNQVVNRFSVVRVELSVVEVQCNIFAEHNVIIVYDQVNRGFEDVVTWKIP